MSKITKKGQITIPQEKRNKFLNWLGRGKQRNKENIDLVVDQVRGKIDE